MKDITATTANNTTRSKDDARKLSDETTALDRRYGQIGISAVAAAVRYQGSAKNPAYAPARTKEHDSEPAA